ncbi:SIR2-like domain containing protein [Bifidobacterium pseudolongum subsp. pseudolongum]|uniref:SIR2-like domain containing protein n=1 Tax=Bifidobacterium pseudolongum subsp. pseudolongum TaxID=31954 RepID=A0A4Q5A898_9BIFI|nr:SIR2 family protein [Bifidobacterium pseudolongum]RYQ20462.1 SIR2-like domain containing protein [Bifidobacterium pseudolongum subsp. pseudolongum]
MWVTENVEFPDELVDAALNDELVLFVGSGVSLDAPANLPSYPALVEQLADEQGVDPPKPKTPLDGFLGNLQDRESAHERTLQMMSSTNADCNETHKAIMRIAHATKTPRIVTTNYDVLLEKAASSLSMDIDRIYRGPALPLGSSFDGIVHLHGDIHSRPDEIILDDRDYAQAYLLESWASRFLVEMFRHYSVLFVGYGISDPIMRYLTLGGISQDHPHFALSAASDKNKEEHESWDERGITTILFPLSSDASYEELPKALNSFADQLCDDYLTKKSRIERIVCSTPATITRDDRDFLVRALHTTEGIQCFTNNVTRQDNGSMQEWVLWLLEDPATSRPFTTSQALTDEELLLCRRVTDILASEKYVDTLCALLIQIQHTVGDRFFNGCFNLLIHECENMQGWAVKPLTVLLSSNLRKELDHAYYIDIKSLLSINFPIYLLSQFIFPVASYRQEANIEYSTVFWSAEIDDRHEDEPINDESIYFSDDFIEFSEYSIKQYSQYETVNKMSVVYRPAIEPHDQNQRHDETSSFFIEVLREYARYHADDNQAIAERWWKSGVPLLQRLSVSAITMSDRTADNKLSWILDKGIIVSIKKHMWLWHELMLLLHTSISEASPDIRGALLQQVQNININEAYNDSDVAITQYDMLDFMLKALPENSWQEASALAEGLARKYDYTPAENPDFLVWNYPIQCQPIQGIVDDKAFLAMLRNDPLHLLLLLTSQEDPWMINDTFSYQIPRLIGDDAQIGLTLWDLASSDHDKNLQLRAAVLSGWAYHKQSPTNLRSIVTRFNQLPRESTASFSDITIRLIHTQMEKADDVIPEDVLDWMDSFAATQWTERHVSFIAQNRADWENDPITLSLNCWPGELAWYWVHRIQYRKAHSSSNWSGFNEVERSALSQFAQAEGDLAFITHAPLLFNMNLLHELDNDFTEKIIPWMLQTDDTVIVWRVITQYHIQPNLRLMRLFFFKSLHCLLKKRLDADPRFIRGLMHIILRALNASDLTEAEKKELQQAVVNEPSHIAKVALIDCTVAQFTHADQTTRDPTWDIWLREYIHSRSRNIGTQWSNEERVQFSRLIPMMGNHIDEATQVLANRLPDYSDTEPYLIHQMFDVDVHISAMDEDNIKALLSFYSQLIRIPSIRNEISPREISQLLAHLKDAAAYSEYSELVQSAKDYDLYDLE